MSLSPRSDALRAAGRLVGSSAAGAALGAVACGLIDAAPATETIGHALAATGYVALLLVPLGLVLSLLGRGLWAAWRPRALAAALTEPYGGAPRLAAWLIVALAGLGLLATLVLEGLQAVMTRSTAPIVHLLAAPIIATAAAVLLLAVSRPAADGLTAALRALDQAVVVRTGRVLLRPAALLAGAAAIGALATYLSWRIVVAPRIGHLDLGFARALLAWLVVLLAVPPLLGWLRARGPRRAAPALAAVAVAAALVPLGAAVWLRVARPAEMLLLWGETQLAGRAIDLVHDVETLRDEIEMAHIAPTPRPGAPATRPDIVLVTIDTLRADQTPLHGGRTSMPSLGSLSTSAAVFEWAFSPGNVTRRSLPAIATGRSPPRIMGRVAGWALRLDPRHVMLAERLAAAGYDTAGFFCCESQFGPRHKLGLDRGIRHLEIDKDGGVLADRLTAFLAARGDATRPLFVWVHLLEPHNWEKDHPPRGEARTRRERYGKALEEVDLHLGRILAAAFPPARRDRTVLVVTADHGESLGDHGSKTHATTLYNSEVHVPLVIAAPGVKARRILRPVGLVDLAPTLLDLAGFVPPGMPEMDGASLGPVLRGEAPSSLADGRAYIVQMADRSVARTLRAVVLGRHKLIVDGDGDIVGLFDYVSDRGEIRDLAKVQPELEKKLEAELRRRRDIDWEMATGR